jgi:hypothetical protein
MFSPTENKYIDVHVYYVDSENLVAYQYKSTLGVFRYDDVCVITDKKFKSIILKRDEKEKQNKLVEFIKKFDPIKEYLTENIGRIINAVEKKSSLNNMMRKMDFDELTLIAMEIVKIQKSINF